MGGPLGSVRVLELTTSIAGPYCGLILGALGADVVKLEPPGRGDDTRGWGPPFWNGESPTFLQMNAGKRSLVLDLQKPEGVEAARRVAATMDVVVQNLRPGLADRLGLGFGALASRNPKLVYCELGAFGKRGPLKDEPGYDPLMQASGGIMSVTGEPGRPPVRAGVSLVDQGSGMWAAIGILAALRLRDEGAGPQIVDLSLYETAVNWLPHYVVGYLASGDVPKPRGTGVAMIAPYEAFETADGRVMIAAGNDRLYRRLCETLELDGLADDSRFSTNADRVANRDALGRLLAERVARYGSEALIARLRQAGIPVAPLQDVADVAASLQTKALELLQPLPHPHVPDLRLVGLPLSFDGERVRYVRPSPLLGEHTADVLRDAGIDGGELEHLLESGTAVQSSGEDALVE
jgi:crotonobetainyl-CoA:carnitine CoA-transferase CaiB-like acyl-CoA transferase